MSVEPNQTTNELTLVDYFVVVGYDSAVGLQVDNNGSECGAASGTSSGSGAGMGKDHLITPPLERCYTASILMHFPEKRAGMAFPSEIVSLCMPKGLKFYTQNDVPQPSVHTFANIREDGSRLNGCALIYYEKVCDMSLCERISELQTEHIRALTEKRADKRASDRTHLPPGTISGGTHTLPRGSRKDRAKRISYYDACGGSQLYVSKCLCILSRIAIVSCGELIITTLHSIFTSPNQPPELPLESYIYWVINEVPLPAPGSTLKVGMCGVDIVLQRPAPGELPFFDYSLRSLFDLLTVDKFLKLFTCFLLEHQILLCSKSLSRLMLVAESLCALAFPFRWQLTYVPILPYSQLKFMEAPVPYIMGLCYEECIPEQIFQSNVCVLDIDRGELDMPEDVPPLPDRNEFAREVANVLIRFDVDNNKTKADNAVGGSTSSPQNCPRTYGTSPYTRQKSTRSTKDDWQSKRISRSFDDDVITGTMTSSPYFGGNGAYGGGMDGAYSGGIPSKADLQPLPLDDVLKQSEVLARVAAIVRRAGVDVKMENIEKELQSNDSYTNSPICRRYFKEMKLNQAIREVFLNRLCWLLYSYEHFVIVSSHLASKQLFYDSVTNFDKAAFLSDQPDSNQPFMAAFLETQMFTSFIDAKIVSQWENLDENLSIFDSRLEALKERYGLQMVRTPTYEKALPFNVAEEAIAKREESLDYIVPQPHALPGAVRKCYEGVFPEVNSHILEGNLAYSSPLPSPWKQRHRRLRPKHQENVQANDPQGSTVSAGGGRASSTTYIADTPKQIAHQNFKFVEQLLKETKGKTKRMLVEKMGKEALQLGHAEASVNGLEENTLVASFCDLLERIWAHGLIKKQGKSSLWAHVLHHQELEKSGAVARTAFVRNSMLTPAVQYADDYQYYNSSCNEIQRPIGAGGRRESFGGGGLATGRDRNAEEWEGHELVDLNGNKSGKKNVLAELAEMIQEEFSNYANNQGKNCKNNDDNNIHNDGNMGGNKAGGSNLGTRPGGDNNVHNNEDTVSKVGAGPGASRPSAPRAGASQGQDQGWNSSMVVALGSVPELGVEGSWAPAEPPAWSVQILRAANFICDKLAGASGASGIGLQQRAAPRNQSTYYNDQDQRADEAGYERQNRAGYSSTDSKEQPVVQNCSLIEAGNETGESAASRGQTTSLASVTSSFAILRRSSSIRNIKAPSFLKNANFMTKGDERGRRRPIILHKANSLSDFAPHWSSGSGANSSDSTPETGGGSPRKRSGSRAHSPDPKQGLPALPMHIAYDLRNVLRMTDIKTDIGYARAFVRLALERKLLHKHLKTILSNTALLQQIYKRYAFVRCDDEKEQFLYHILSLNAAQFRCFTNTFTKTKMQYRVLLVSGNTRSVLSSPIWVLIAGSLCSTTLIDVKPGVMDFKFDHKNLGILSTLRIGHSLASLSNGMPPKWFLDHVMVRNEVTGQTYRFMCGRWFGRGVDDGSLERLLVAEILPQVDPDAEVLMEGGFVERGGSKAHSRSRTPPRARSPSATRSEALKTKSRSRLTEIQQQLGEAVNGIVKYFYSSDTKIRDQTTAPMISSSSKSELTQLLCAADKGFVSVMVNVFLYGRQVDSIWSGRFNFKQQYPWDYIEKVCVWFYELIRMEDAKKLTREQRSLISQACRLVRRISANTNLGKDGKFQLFILVTLRDHVLSGLIPLMAWTPVTTQLYDEPSFLRTPHYLTYLSRLLNSLNEFHFDLEKSLTYGIE